ncbi:DUF4245 domain-containing protein [Pseudonocardiaceae bacterium YIM PH 21723]|nr:DUF4245 domain-containing protein [Pseudonocardiaceae bacterium YIM PH 21723]
MNPLRPDAGVAGAVGHYGGMSGNPKLPSPPVKKDRALLTTRDMMWSMAALLVIVFVVAGFSRTCSFAPGEPEINPGVGPTVDVGVEMRRFARTVDFAVRSPAVPARWRANAANVLKVDRSPSKVVARVGWLTAEGGYLRFSQSTAEEAALIQQDGASPDYQDPDVTIGDKVWHSYPAQREEKLWSTSFDGVQITITGSAAEADFRELAQDIAKAPIVPRTG